MLKVFYSFGANFDKSLLSRERQAKLDALRTEDAKLQSATAELLVLHALKQRGLQTLPPIDRTAKPKFENCTLDFSLSHTQGMATAAVHEEIVGVDCEKIRPIVDISRLFLSESERLSLTEGDGFNLELLRRWTAKEAYVKAVGLGLSKIGKCIYTGNAISMDGYPTLTISTLILDTHIISAASTSPATFIQVKL